MSKFVIGGKQANKVYEIDYTPEAIEDLRLFKKHEQQSILDQADEQLLYEPALVTHNRKKFRPNQELMSFLDECGKQKKTIKAADVRNNLALSKIR